MDLKREFLISDKLSNPDELSKLLRLAKEEKGFDESKLVFMGMANIAKYYWCPMQSFLRCKSRELDFFRAYLLDRIRYANELGQKYNLPKNDHDILHIGSDISFEDIEKLLEKRAEKHKPEERSFWDAITTVDKSGNKVTLINPDAPEHAKEYIQDIAAEKGMKIDDIRKYPQVYGEYLHTKLSENYPTIRWNFEWNDYVIVGVPDGITKKFVYEYKTSKNRFLALKTKQIAFTQADLYGHFFKRNQKRVQIYIKEEDKRITYDEKVDSNNVINTLENIKKIEMGWIPPIPEDKWKCKNCDEKEECFLIRKGEFNV